MSTGQNPQQGGIGGFSFGSQPIGTAAPNVSASASGGFAFAAPQAQAQQAPTASTGGLGQGFSFGSGGTGLTMPVATPQSTAQPTSASTGLGFSFGIGQPTLAPASAAVAPVVATPVSAAVTPQSTAATSSLFTGFGTLSTATAAPSGFSVVSSLAQSTPATGVTTPSSVAQSLLTKTTPTTTAPLTMGFGGFGTATTTNATAATTAVTTVSSSAVGGAALPAPITYAQLAENLNKWVIELEDNEKQFLTQATQVNAWDTLLSANAQRIVQLHESVERVKADQSRLDRELDFIRVQQQELDECLVPLEQSLEDRPPGDPEREKTYHMAESIDSQLKRMTEDMKEIIEYLNNSQQSADTTDPLTQISRILNKHINSLQWMDQNVSLVQAKLDEVSKLQDSHRQIHESNFSMTYN